VLRLDDGSVVVTDDIGVGGGCHLRESDWFHPVKSSVDGERCVVGGLLPPGALSVEAVDDRGVRVPAAVGHGAYVAVLDQPGDGSEPIICCRDADGRPVRRPRAADYPSVGVLDAQEPCPACGAFDFEEYRPFEGWRGGGVLPDGTTVPCPVVRCRVCGHEEEEGMVVRAPARPAAVEKAPTRAELISRARAMRREHMWRAVASGVQTQGFPIYGVDGWSAQLTGCGAEDDGRLTYVTVHHYATDDAEPSPGTQPRLAVTTKREDPRDSGPLGEARQALRGWVRPKGDRAGTPDGSHAASTLWHKARSRAQNAAALDAVQSEHAITIDGQPITALMLTSSATRWVAVAVRGNLTIIVAGHDVDPKSLSLRPIGDPAEEFGPRSPDV
jgi:hypothetical protein